jgi:uncharacterized lipoprotein YbaY
MFQGYHGFSTRPVSHPEIVRGKVISSRNGSDIFRGNEILEISVVDASRMDATSIVLGRQRIPLQSGQQFPIRFEVSYDKSRIGHGYGGCSLQARIVDRYDRLIYINDTHTEVKHKVNIDVRRV